MAGLLADSATVRGHSTGSKLLRLLLTEPFPRVAAEPVVSPVKVALTPAKDGEGTDEVVTQVRAAEEATGGRGERPKAWQAAAVGEGAARLYNRGRGRCRVRQVPPPSSLFLLILLISVLHPLPLLYCIALHCIALHCTAQVSALVLARPIMTKDNGRL